MRNVVATHGHVPRSEVWHFAAERGAGREEVVANAAATHTRSEWMSEFHSETEKTTPGMVLKPFSPNALL